MTQEQASVITVDGPSGSGKGTISARLARHLGWRFLDSGALYRLVALAVQNHAIEMDNQEAIVTLAAHLDVQFETRGDSTRIILEGEDVTDTIRTEKVGNAASQVAAIGAVREALLARQRDFRGAPGLIADGRDMGTVVFPDASLKIFLTASAEERAKRRYKQLNDKGLDVNLADLLQEISERDKRDMERAVSPLVPADDAIQVDTTGVSIEQVFDKVLNLCEERGLVKSGAGAARVVG
ncbi:MAG: (d)CMP kinase [Gammaproteobacteria bacterium]|nr:(d)CMP kinase [Gammaproteobacteria bacterium]